MFLKELIECIKNSTEINTSEVQTCITGMVCLENDPIPLSNKNLLNALKIDGEFLVLKLHYNDFEDEIKSQKIKYKISQALSVVVSYEDDGSSYDEINKFVEYINSISDEKQNSTFGVKKVEKLSEYPITILFSGILPINQLQMSVGKDIDALIHSDDKYFLPRFQVHRDAISQEIGISILPVLPRLDESLEKNEVRLIDQTNNKVISKFRIEEKLDKDTVEIYLLKLFYVYKVLANKH